MKPFPKGAFRDPKVPPCYTVTITTHANGTDYELLDDKGWRMATVHGDTYDDVLIRFTPSREDVIRAFKLLCPAGSSVKVTRVRRAGHQEH